MTISNEQEYITIEFNNGDQQRHSKPAFAPSVKVEEITNGQVKMVSLTTFPNLDAVKTHFTKLGYSFY